MSAYAAIEFTKNVLSSGLFVYIYIIYTHGYVSKCLKQAFSSKRIDIHHVI
jgi:hypothetical protein